MRAGLSIVLLQVVHFDWLSKLHFLVCSEACNLCVLLLMLCNALNRFQPVRLMSCGTLLVCLIDCAYAGLAQLHAQPKPLPLLIQRSVCKARQQWQNRDVSYSSQ